MAAREMKLTLAMFCVLLGLSAKAQNQDTVRARENYSISSQNPIVFVDSIRIPWRDVNDVNPDSVWSATVLKGPAAISAIGPEGASGVIKLTTKKSRKKQVVAFLMSKSPEYRNLVMSGNADQILYIINDHVDQGYFLKIDEKTFESVKIVKTKKLPRQFRDTKMKWGVIIACHLSETTQ